MSSCRATNANPNHSRQSLEFCKRVARNARAEVERIEEIELCLRAGECLARGLKL